LDACIWLYVWQADRARRSEHGAVAGVDGFSALETAVFRWPGTERYTDGHCIASRLILLASTVCTSRPVRGSSCKHALDKHEVRRLAAQLKDRRINIQKHIPHPACHTNVSTLAGLSLGPAYCRACTNASGGVVCAPPRILAKSIHNAEKNRCTVDPPLASHPLCSHARLAHPDTARTPLPSDACLPNCLGRLWSWLEIPPNPRLLAAGFASSHLLYRTVELALQ
jgi:hypothetical protein